MTEDKLQDHKTPAIYRCAYPAPYPEVKVTAPNPYYATLLLEDYAGQVSELSAINQYVYHHVVLEPDFEEVADLLECIALVEMHHLEILAETILMLGVDPRYRTIAKNETEQYWDASFVYYGTSLCDRLTADIASEWAAIANYRRHQNMINDPYIRNILERIILDELHHIMLFNQMVDKYCRPQMQRE
ncbi:MAG TPA: bacterioferritin [Firmicutes bacterium]|nr:bacterioferritin [Bacillota bacterium]